MSLDVAILYRDGFLYNYDDSKKTNSHLPKANELPNVKGVTVV